MRVSSPQKQGFSLVELSIVLVILGLLTGGILTGQSLIRAAELRSVTTEYQRYITAVRTFQDKYFAIPGDMTNATAFWGASANCPATTTQGTTDGSTCNGDGDGLIEYYGGVGGGSREIYRFWQHLSNAGLIEGNYSGVVGPDNSIWDTTPGVNIPKSKLSSAGWSVVSIVYDEDYTYPPAIGGDLAGNWEMDHTNQLWFGRETTIWTSEAALTPEELWNIDTKMDDGKPLTGKLLAGRVPNCTDTSSTVIDATVEYNLASSDVSCAIMFPKPF